MTQLTNVVFIQAKPGMGEALGTRLLALVEPARAEPGCINYDLHRSNDRPDLWLVYENWRDAEDLVSHMRMPYMEALLRDLPALVQGEVVLQPFTMVSAFASH
jgi:quinol monooxygenase YgiN